MKARLKRYALPLAAAGLALLCVACLLAYGHLALLLDSQRQAERWQGESETEFRQLSCFMAVDEKLSLEQVYTFRKAMMDKFHEAALDIGTDSQLFCDAWCSFGSVKVASDQGKGEVSLIAVGGNYFDFHPIRLLSGNYISPDDLMKDRVLLDEDVAWLLFGGTELSGMSFKINGQPFVVAGVIEREPGEDPGTREIAETCDLVRSLGVPALFVEPQYPQRAAETIARETGAAIFTLDPAVTGDGAPDSYERAMRENARVLTEALEP